MIQGAVDQKPVWDISGAPETLSKGFSLGISVWRVTLCLCRHHSPGTPLPAPGGRRQWDKHLSQEVMRLQFRERNRNHLNKGWKSGGQWGFHSSLSLAPKPGKNSVSSPLHTNANPSQKLGSHPDTAQKTIIPPPGAMLWGLTGLPCNSHCGHPGFLSSLP